MSNPDKGKTTASEILEDALGEVKIPDITSMSLASELLENQSSAEVEVVIPTQTGKAGEVTEFCKRYFKNRDNGDVRRTNTSISTDVMDKLKSVIFYLDPKCALNNYIENILIAHLEAHKDLINDSVAKRIKPTII